MAEIAQLRPLRSAIIGNVIQQNPLETRTEAAGRLANLDSRSALFANHQ